MDQLRLQFLQPRLGLLTLREVADKSRKEASFGDVHFAVMFTGDRRPVRRWPWPSLCRRTDPSDSAEIGLALAIVVTHFVRPETRFLQAAWARYVVVCGQQSLQIFCLGILLAVVGHFILSEVTRALRSWQPVGG